GSESGTRAPAETSTGTRPPPLVQPSTSRDSGVSKKSSGPGLPRAAVSLLHSAQDLRSRDNQATLKQRATAEISVAVLFPVRKQQCRTPYAGASRNAHPRGRRARHCESQIP